MFYYRQAGLSAHIHTQHIAFEEDRSFEDLLTKLIWRYSDDLKGAGNVVKGFFSTCNRREVGGFDRKRGL